MLQTSCSDATFGLNLLFMLRNYFKIAFRSLWRNRTHSAINIIGLSVGVACCLLISLFVYDELSFDRFHSKSDRIYRVFGRENWGENQDFFYTVTPFPMGPTLKENLPNIERQVRITRVGVQVKQEGSLTNESLTVAGIDFFNMFDFEVIRGEAENAFAQQNSLVLSQSFAGRYFGDQDPIGKSLAVQLVGDQFEEFVISAVVKVPVNSSIRFGLMVSDLNLPKLYSQQTLTSRWFNINPETYVLLRPGVSPEAVVAKFPALFRTILGEDEFEKSNYAPGLQSITDIHLNPAYPAGLAPVSDPQYAYILSAIAGLILFVACINFVTLSIGRSVKRAREVGIRKVVGAARRQLVVQFIGEAVMVTMVSLSIGLGLALLCLPLFNELSGKQLDFSLDGFTAAVLGSLLLVIGLFAGSYPAFVLSAFRPVAVLKGVMHGSSGKQGLRKALVAVQLALSIFLITSTLIMRSQLQFLQNKNLGFNREQVLVIPLTVTGSGNLAQRVQNGFTKASLFKEAFNRYPGVVATCASSHDFGNGSWTNVGFTDDNGVYRNFNLNVIDEEYMTTMRMKLTAGRAMTASPADHRRGVVVNEAFMNLFGWSDFHGKRIPGKNFADHEIIGVVKDFHYASLYTSVEPLAMVANLNIILPGIENINIGNSPIPKVLVRLRPANMASTIEQLRASWHEITGGEVFSFEFVDDALANQYATDRDLQRIITAATILAIVIGCLGLYALASLAMESRNREIAVRKVFGATERSLLVLLVGEYVVLTLIALALSVPITLLWMDDWLSAFAYKVPLGMKEFVIAGGASVVVALLTISYQTVRTAWTRPAETLKYE